LLLRSTFWLPEVVMLLRLVPASVSPFAVRKVIAYFYRRNRKNIHKQVVYLLAETADDQVKISSEHQDFGWFPYPEAVAQASYDNSKALLAEAERFLTDGQREPLRPQN
jgi:hypothetical protein